MKKRSSRIAAHYTTFSSSNIVTGRTFNGMLHRRYKPAIIYSDGTKAWYVDGKLHRETGPAIIKSDGTREWWVNGTQLDPLVYIIKQTKFD